MPNYGPSISERWKKVCEEVTMGVGAGGFTGAADPAGPVAGFDPLMGQGKDPLLKRTLARLKKPKKKKKS